MAIKTTSFTFLVPVVVRVEHGTDDDGEPINIVSRVTVIDEASIGDYGPPTLDGEAPETDEDKALLAEAVAAAESCDDWPSWELGF